MLAITLYMHLILSSTYVNVIHANIKMVCHTKNYFQFRKEISRLHKVYVIIYIICIAIMYFR